jgi:hypothetical protein
MLEIEVVIVFEDTMSGLHSYLVCDCQNLHTSCTCFGPCGPKFIDANSDKGVVQSGCSNMSLFCGNFINYRSQIKILV